ncbi:hypothetical protein DM01DRAFT_1387239 [Hesseltinella vesiculosa]|uniref:GYF domain-containing protein n=1 Tax=Hesseltinella vesiculosa TaxID=101127 RepID=A0A1X2G2L0_9FUNG|nr:hypothetical protein DM01DRAFT_1387239 [Hesseltinella vesiculosa]
MTANMNFGAEWMRDQQVFGLEKQENQFKYSKEYMLSLYRPMDPPQQFEHVPYATVQHAVQPLAFEQITDDEHRLLQGPVHVDAPRPFRQSQGKNHQDRHQWSRGRRADGDDGWADHRRHQDGGRGAMHHQRDQDRRKESAPFQWYYRDPSGKVQGPFEADMMQEWFKAGFFGPTLMIRREDQPDFEPLASWANKICNDDEMFTSRMPVMNAPPGLGLPSMANATPPAVGTNPLLGNGPVTPSTSTSSISTMTPNGSVMGMAGTPASSALPAQGGARAFQSAAPFSLGNAGGINGGGWSTDRWNSPLDLFQQQQQQQQQQQWQQQAAFFQQQQQQQQPQQRMANPGSMMMDPSQHQQPFMSMSPNAQQHHQQLPMDLQQQQFGQQQPSQQSFASPQQPASFLSSSSSHPQLPSMVDPLLERQRSNHASPIVRPAALNGWRSGSGTPVETPSSPWGNFVSPMAANLSDDRAPGSPSHTRSPSPKQGPATASWSIDTSILNKQQDSLAWDEPESTSSKNPWTERADSQSQRGWAKAPVSPKGWSSTSSKPFSAPSQSRSAVDVSASNIITAPDSWDQGFHAGSGQSAASNEWQQPKQPELDQSGWDDQVSHAAQPVAASVSMDSVQQQLEQQKQQLRELQEQQLQLQQQKQLLEEKQKQQQQQQQQPKTSTEDGWGDSPSKTTGNFGGWGAPTEKALSTASAVDDGWGPTPAAAASTVTPAHAQTSTAAAEPKPKPKLVEQVATNLKKMSLQEIQKEEEEIAAKKRAKQAHERANAMAAMLIAEEEAAKAAATMKKLTPPAIPKVKAKSLREIQQEELRKQEQEKKHMKNKPLSLSSSGSLTSTWSPATGGWTSVTEPKGPSLREIQALEQKESDKKRKDSERRARQQAAATVIDDEPLDTTTLSWGVVTPGTRMPPSAPANNASPWAISASTSSSGKKTVRDIQSEELQQHAPPAWHTSYDDYEEEVNGDDWTTVQAKPKPVQPKTGPASYTWDSVVGATAKKAAPSNPGSAVKLVRPTAAATLSQRDASTPSDEFKTWCRNALRQLNPGVNPEEIISMFMSFPMESSTNEIIQDIIYANSTVMDGRRFASEFMKRRRAELTKVIPQEKKAALPGQSHDSFQVVGKKGKKSRD